MVHILIDLGSTNNFLDSTMTRRLGCKLVSTCPLQVAVPGETNFISTFACKGFQWLLQGYNYSTDVMLLQSGGCDMVLGIQWLATLGNIQWNFQNLTMAFKCDGSSRVLQGISQSPVKWINDKQCDKAMTKGTL